MQVPVTTVEFLDAVKARRGLTSDYQLYKFLGWHQTTISNYRCGKTAMAGAHAIKIADELTLPRAYVLTCMEAERERNDQVAHVWRELAKRLRTAAAIILIGLAGGTFGGKVEASQLVRSVAGDPTQPTAIYIMRTWRRLRRCILSLRSELERLQGFLKTLIYLTAQALQAA